MSALEPLWKIEDELQTLVDSLDTCPEELKDELEQKIARYVTAEIDKLDKVGAMLTSLEGVQANAKAEIERLRLRQQAAEKAAARLEGYILHVLRQRDGRPLKGRNVTFSVRRTESVVIDDPNQVPEQWKRVTVTTDVPKVPIKEAIKAGQFVPGARLQTNEHLVKR
jgi:Siphovirus Gp157